MKSKSTMKRNPVSRAMRVRDVLCTDASLSTPAQDLVTTDSNGNRNATYSFAPVGVSIPKFTTTGSVVVVSTQSWENSHLPWLRTNALGYERYRVLAATAIFVPSVGSTAPGRITLLSSTDATDVYGLAASGGASGGKQYSLAAGANKELRFALDIDSSWKRVTSITGIPRPTDTAQMVPLNTINDLCFSHLFLNITGAAATSVIGTFSVEYTVEFKDPITVGTNN